MVIVENKEEKPRKKRSKIKHQIISRVLGNVEIAPKTDKAEETIPVAPVVKVVENSSEVNVKEKSEKVVEKELKTILENQSQISEKQSENIATIEKEQKIYLKKPLNENSEVNEIISKPKVSNKNLQTLSGLETGEQVVGKIIKGLEEDLETLKNPPINNESDEVKAAWRKVKYRIYKYRFTDHTQMKLFKEKFPKKAITEAQAKHIFDFWENNYAEFYPNMARSDYQRKQWKEEIKKVLNIIPTPEVGQFNRTTGGQVFIIDTNTENGDSGWVAAQ